VLIGLLEALAAMVMNSVGALLTADAAGRATRKRPIAVQPRYFAALGVDLIGFLCAVAALRELPVFAVQAVIGGSIALTAVAGARLNDAFLTRRTRIAVVASISGLALVAASAGTEHPPVTAGIVDAILISAVLVLGVAVLVLRQYRRAWPLALCAGLGFGGISLAVRAAHVEVGPGFSLAALLAQPGTYLVVGFWVLGMVAWSAALARGEVGTVTALLLVTQVVVPGLVGIALLGDPVRAGWAWPFVIGLVVAVIGVVVLARNPPRQSRVT
jgi:drug/metabolite transporter (DMT)-like permease